MKVKSLRRLLALAAAMILLLSACTPSGKDPDTDKETSKALTWNIWGRYETHKAFLELVNKTYPDIEIELFSYRGANRTTYSWEQMRADDISDIFITSQILDEGLVKERLMDLSNYSFVNNFSDKTLKQLEIDGGVYLLPANYSMYGIYYNKTLMEENGWEVPANFAELEVLCSKIREAGMIPGIAGTNLTGDPFSTVFNLAKTSWLTTPAGVQWEQDFLAGNASAEGMWEATMEYVQKYIDIGMLFTDPEDRIRDDLMADYLGERKAVFFTAAATTLITTLKNGDELGMMPYIGEDGSKNIYMYSPSCYFGLSKRLTEPGNEQKLENAVKILELLFSAEGQQSLLGESTPCVMSALESNLSEDSLIYDAQQALRDGRAFPMTYAHWENVIPNMGQAYKDWFRGENEMDGPKCIAQMDAIQQKWLNEANQLYFCESTANFTKEETARLVAKALGSAVSADAVLISLNEFHEGGEENQSGIGGKLYAGKIDLEVATAIAPNADGEYAIMTMTGAEAKALAEAGFDMYENGKPFPYILVTKGGVELADGERYQVAFLAKGYTEATAKTYSAKVQTGSLRTMLQEWLKAQGTVSPDGNPWK